jgi:hypothetical protein
MRPWIVAATGGVLLWRVAAFFWPSSFIATPDPLRLPFALLGVLFLACGLWAWWMRPDRWTRVFQAYALSGAIHWGGAIGAPHQGLELGLFFTYLGITVAGGAALLHLALIYPRGGELARGWRIALYAPAGVAVVFALFTWMAPREIIEILVGFLMLVGELFAFGAGGTFLVRLFATDGATRRAARLPLIMAALVGSFLVALLGTSGYLPGHSEAWNLVLGSVPIGLAIALVSSSHAGAREGNT